MPIHEVTLADVYHLDFGRRTEDLMMWTALAHLAPAGSVLDVGCGDGRATRDLIQLGRPVLGFDPNGKFNHLARINYLVTPTSDEATLTADYPESYHWARMVNKGAGFSLVVCAYSTLWLMPHIRQATAITLMAEALLPGGVLAIEVFIPEYTENRVVDSPCCDPNDPTRPPWVRRSTFRINHALRRTEITRLYGPVPEQWTMRLEETVYWRDPADLLMLARRAGLSSAEVLTGPAVLGQFGEGGVRARSIPVAKGHALLVCSR